MRKCCLPALALAAGFASPASAEHWSRFGLTGSGRLTEVDFVDLESLSQLGNTFSVDTFRGSHNGLGDRPGVIYDEGKLEISCTQRKFRIMAEIDYAADRSIVLTSGPEAGWHAVGQGTLAGAIWQFACEGRYTDRLIADPFKETDDYFGGSA